MGVLGSQGVYCMYMHVNYLGMQVLYGVGGRYQDCVYVLGSLGICMFVSRYVAIKALFFYFQLDIHCADNSSLWFVCEVWQG